MTLKELIMKFGPSIVTIIGILCATASILALEGWKLILVLIGCVLVTLAGIGHIGFMRGRRISIFRIK